MSGFVGTGLGEVFPKASVFSDIVTLSIVEISGREKLDHSGANSLTITIITVTCRLLRAKYAAVLL